MSGAQGAAVALTHGLGIVTGDGHDVVSLDHLTTADNVSINTGGRDGH